MYSYKWLQSRDLDRLVRGRFYLHLNQIFIQLHTKEIYLHISKNKEFYTSKPVYGSFVFECVCVILFLQALESSLEYIKEFLEIFRICEIISFYLYVFIS